MKSFFKYNTLEHDKLRDLYKTEEKHRDAYTKNDLRLKERKEKLF